MQGDQQSSDSHPDQEVNDINGFLATVKARFDQNPFKPHPVFTGAHAQTLAAYAWPRRHRLKSTIANDEERLFSVDAGVQVLAQCRWQSNRQKHPTIVIWHGMEGSTSSIYMWSTAAKAFTSGFNVLRVNYRSCGNTEHLTPTIYHGGLSGDLHKIIDELIKVDKLKRIYPIGFSLGGNMVLKLAGEYGENPPKEVAGACVISPSVDLRASTDLILKRSNWLYHKSFVRSMKARMRRKNRLQPGLFDAFQLKEIRTIKDFDERVTAVANGFADANDYYAKESATRVVNQIRVPTLIIHAQDDPFIPFEPLSQSGFVENSHLLLIKTTHGGHVAFVGTNKSEDRFWAENRVIEFCQLREKDLTTSGSV